MTASSFTKSSIKIPSATPSWDLDAWQYIPHQDTECSAAGARKPLPVVIMAHGLSANKLMSVAPYAEAFASRGYACIVFDYRRWGESGNGIIISSAPTSTNKDGTPRHVLTLSEQLEDYRTLVEYVRQRPEFDLHKVVLWGTSLSGGHVIALASKHEINPAAVICQSPYVGVKPLPPLTLPLLQSVLYATLDAIKQWVGLPPVYIPVVAAPGEVGILTADGNLEGMRRLAKNSKDYSNEVSASSFFQLLTYRPSRNCGSIACPLLVIAQVDDNVCGIQGAIDLVAAVHKAEFVKIPGSGHFDVYPGTERYETSLAAQMDFLRRHVPV